MVDTNKYCTKIKVVMEATYPLKALVSSRVKWRKWINEQ